MQEVETLSERDTQARESRRKDHRNGQDVQWNDSSSVACEKSS